MNDDKDDDETVPDIFQIMKSYLEDIKKLNVPHHLFLAVSNIYFTRRTQHILLYSISPLLLIIFETHLHSIHISRRRFIQRSSQNLLSGLNWIGFFLSMCTGTSLPNMQLSCPSIGCVYSIIICTPGFLSSASRNKCT